MFFAYEDREQIIELLIESVKRLAVAVSIYNVQEVKPVILWECIDAFMIDTVAKNPIIVDIIAMHFESNHKPHHTILCSGLKGRRLLASQPPG